MNNCRICNNEVEAGDIYLLDASSIHQYCLSQLKLRETKVNNPISELNQIIRESESELSRFSSIDSKIINWFIESRRNYQLTLEQLVIKKKEELNWYQKSRKGILADRLHKLYDVYSYWPQRPPDWEIRRRDKLHKYKACKECGIAGGPLHVHHILSIDKGGDHLPGTLEVLCEICHSDKHGGREIFPEGKSRLEATVAKNYRLFRQAIKESKAVIFKYKKYEGEISSRKIYPKSFEKISNSLCVKEYCTLRNAERVFAIEESQYWKCYKNSGV